MEMGSLAGRRGPADQLNHVLLNKYIRKLLKSEKSMSEPAIL